MIFADASRSSRDKGRGKFHGSKPAWGQPKYKWQLLFKCLFCSHFSKGVQCELCLQLGICSDSYKCKFYSKHFDCVLEACTKERSSSLCKSENKTGQAKNKRCQACSQCQSFCLCQSCFCCVPCCTKSHCASPQSGQSQRMGPLRWVSKRTQRFNTLNELASSSPSITLYLQSDLRQIP